MKENAKKSKNWEAKLNFGGFLGWRTKTETPFCRTVRPRFSIKIASHGSPLISKGSLGQQHVPTMSRGTTLTEEEMGFIRGPSRGEKVNKVHCIQGETLPIACLEVPEEPRDRKHQETKRQEA